MSDCLAAALKFASRGLQVFPVHGIGPSGQCLCRDSAKCENQGKHPATEKGFYDASSNDAVLSVMFSRLKNPNVGLRMGWNGKISIFAIDVDPRNGGDIKAVEAKTGPLPATWTADTGGGGHHFFFSSEEKIKKSKPLPGVDIQGEGSYVVVAPSLHKSGRRYSWRPGLSPEETVIARAPEAVLAFLKQNAAQTGNLYKNNSSTWTKLLGNGVAEGGRNDAMTRIVGHFLRMDSDPALTFHACWAINKSYFMPPLDGDEFSKIFESVRALEVRRRLGSNND